MSGSISKSRTRLYRPKASQQQQLDAVVSTGAEPPPTNGAQTRGHLAPNQPRPRKREFDGISGSDSSPAKKPRLTQAGATGHLRRSTRLQDLQRSEDPIPIAPSTHVPPAGRPRANTQQFGIEREEVKQATQRTPPRRRHTTLTKPKVEGQENVSPTTRLQKRQIDSDDNNEHHPKRARLTRENLAVLNKMGRKKATKAPAPSESSSTKTTSTTTSGFALQGYKNGIRDPLHSKPPANLENLLERHARSRATASPPESEYKRYVNNVGKAANEATMVVKVSAYMLKDYDDPGYLQAFNQPFTGFPGDIGFNNGLSAPQPDFVEGLEMQEFRPFPVDELVQGAVLYKNSLSSLTLPHLAGEWKGGGKDMKKAELQSGYDGTALVYARNQALSYIGESDPPGHAGVTTFTTDGTNVNFYAHYAAPTEDGTLEYHQYQYASANVKDSHQGHRDGRRGLRNQQDHAREQSYDLRNRLKEHWTQCRDPIAEGVPDDNFEETNANEDEAGYEIVEQPCQPTPDASLLSENDYAPSSGGYNRKPSSPSNALPVDELEAAEEQQDGDSDPEFVDCEEYKSDAGEPPMSFATSAPTSFSAQTHTSSKRHRYSPPSNSQPFKKHSAPRRSARSSTRVSSSTALVAEHPAAVDGYWTLTSSEESG